MSAPLVDAGELRQLERLRYAQLDALMAGLVGRPVGAAGGRGVEFAEYRPYTPGDDLRRLDANVYARLRQAVVKSSPAERQLGLALLLDASASMGAVALHARRLTALLGAIALLRGDRVRLSLLADGTARAERQLWGPRALGALLEQVEAAQWAARTDLARSVRAARSREGAAQVAVLVSDALAAPDALDEAIVALAAAGSASALVQVVEDAPLSGERGAVELVDAESGARLSVELTSAARAAYRGRVDALVSDVAARCAHHGVAHVRADASGAPLEQLLGLVGAGSVLERTR
jgi:uncharacterized protein (DUF58 family)